MLKTLDIESSGLDDESYPIQIGYTYEVDDEVKTIEFFIKPADHWNNWDQEAEDYIHHIPRSVLKTGLSIKDACLKLNKDLGKSQVIVDSKDYDLFWLNKLYNETNLKMSFSIINIEDYLLKSHNVSNDYYEDTREKYEFSHSAGEDSIVIHKILTDLTLANPA